MFRLATAVLLCTMISIGSAYRVAAEDVTDTDKARFQEIISSQIEAFRADDGARAYSFAAPSIRSKFQTSEIFMTMVRRGYPPVYRPRSVKFGAVTGELGGPTQKVHLIGPGGAAWTALYGMQRQPDGSWKISGVVLVREDDAGA